MKKNLVLRNVLVSIAQVVVTTATLFVLYRYLIQLLGVEALGVWSIVMASSTILSVGELGLSRSIVKYMAKYLALGDIQIAGKILQTGVISLSIILAIVLLITYPLLVWLFSLIFPASSLGMANILLPFSLLYLWLNTLGGGFQSGLDGCLRTDIRGGLVIFSNFLFFGFALFFVPRFGLVGLVYAQLLQALTTVLLGWWLLRDVLAGLPVIPYYWNYKHFREMFVYGVNLQVIGISVMLLEPVTKMLLGKYGNLSMAGYYEIAQRLISQTRAILLAANQALVPVVAHFHETNKKRIEDVYRADYKLLSYISIPAFMGIVALSPVIGELLISHHENLFVFCMIILSFAAVMNILASPAYFMNLGTGDLKWNVISHLAMAVLNLLLGFVLGKLFAGIGIISAIAIATIIGGIVIVVPYHLDHQVAFKELFPKENIILLVACLAMISLNLGIYHYFFESRSNGLKTLLMCLVALVFIFPAVWFHQERKNLLAMLKKGFIGVG